MLSPATCLLLAALCTSAAAVDAVDAVPAATRAPGELLEASESADPKKVDIVKQIRRLNDDGSYTVGYEAGDGTFKIESRDALGNVKGTFGYVDGAGEIKRVTYSSSNASTPTPVQVGSTAPPPTTPPPVVPAALRRPPPTAPHLRPGSPPPLRGTVIQPIPRRRPSASGGSPRVAPGDSEPTTDSFEAPTVTAMKLSKIELESFMKSAKGQTTKPPLGSSTKEILQARPTSTEPSARVVHAVKPVYENGEEKEGVDRAPKANQFRRQLPGASENNQHMLSLQQSAGDDSSDVYGVHRSLGTARPLFTTTTVRPRLAPFTSILAAHHRLQEHASRYPPAAEHETAFGAIPNRVDERESGVTSSPVPALRAPTYRDRVDEALLRQPIYHRPFVQFRTAEYLRDNPGAPVPIGNRRPYLDYEFGARRPQPALQQSGPAGAPIEAATPTPYALAPVTRIIPIAVDERGVPIPGYRFATNPFEAGPPPLPPRRPSFELAADDMQTITTPVSTRDLRRLLQILLLRQNRLQALMDEITTSGPPYEPSPQPQYREEAAPQPDERDFRSSYRTLDVQPRAYRPPPRAGDEPQYGDYRPAYSERQISADERQRIAQQRELYTNHISGFEPSPQYESRRFVPRRRAQYDADAAPSGGGEYLPADVREALLLKMLMLAISPEYMPRTRASAVAPPPTELTTAAPAHRKQVRNVQILGEEGSKDPLERRRAH